MNIESFEFVFNYKVIAVATRGKKRNIFIEIFRFEFTTPLISSKKEIDIQNKRRNVNIKRTQEYKIKHFLWLNFFL